MKRVNVILLLFGILFAGCDLQEIPKDTPNSEQVFSSKRGLEKYANSFYTMLPSASDITHADYLSDYATQNTIPELLRAGKLNARTVDRWDWENLRKINYFLQQNHNSDVTKKVRNNFNGIARFYRAWFYFKKVKKYGKVPWINTPLDLDSEELEAPRDSREMVMDSVLADINYAIAHINTQRESSRTKITKDVALALKSRICLFEGTYRKYHPELNLDNTAESWLQESVDATKNIIKSSAYSVYTGAGVKKSFKEIFTNDQPINTSVLLANVYSEDLGVQHDANWWYTSGTYGKRLSFTRTFINTFLMEDGTPFTNLNNYKTKTFVEEVKNRDARLAQSIRMPNYKMTNSSGEEVLTPPNFSYTYSGYQPIKWIIPDKHYNDRDYNINSIPIFRYAEILLNYAESKAELGSITNADWNKTVGALRRRAGITGGTSTLPSKVDPYLQKTYFPGISDPIILEIRRERGVELALEGFRFDDIRRWKRGELMEMKWLGMYVPSANSYIDLTGNGEPDIYFYTNKKPEDRKDGVQYANIGTDDWSLTSENGGYLIRLPNQNKVWKDKKYLYPINKKDLQKNSNLKQNPGW